MPLSAIEPQNRTNPCSILQHCAEHSRPEAPKRVAYKVHLAFLLIKPVYRAARLSGGVP
jgi:hypothetical protein